MRIKINDKIYRLKEIESGVDSLMELVEEPKYKDGDFVYKDGRIPKRKFKKGDKVRIKHGVSSKTHRHTSPVFVPSMDDLIGKTMTVDRYIYWNNCVGCEEIDWYFLEEWLEPYVEELKKGDLAIFWDLDKSFAFIGKYNGLLVNGSPCPHQDSRGYVWKNAIKFESKEQYEKLLKGEI